MATAAIDENMTITHTIRLGAPFEQQRQFLSLDRQILADGKPAISRANYVGGRGCAKTATGIMLLLKAVADMPGDRLRGFWAEPRHSDIDRIFLTALREIVPAELWELKTRGNYRYIQWANGHSTDLLSRQVDDPNKRVGLGSNYCYGIQDEAADKFQQRKFVDMQNAIRHPNAPYLFHDTLSTPVIGDYEAWCRQPGARIVRSSSYDNIYISDAVIDSWRASMSPDLVRQEIDGEFVALSGRIWSSFVEAPYPEGNILEGFEFRPDDPFWLACDLGGAQSAFQIIQYWEGHPVIVAELTPNNMGLPAALDEIVRTYCGGYDERRQPMRAPVMTFVGHDVATPGSVGIPGSQVFASFGWAWETPQGVLSRKDVQRNAASSIILNSIGERTMLIAAKRSARGVYETRQHFGEGKTRGILNVMRYDQYPDPASREIFIKDKATRGVNALEDDRDAFLYWAVGLHPPAWGLGALTPMA